MTRGTIVLTPFPFTDLSGNKLRPALVVTPTNRFGNDVVLAFISSNRARTLNATDLQIENTHPEFAKTGLKVSSVIRLEKLVTIDRSIIRGALGKLPSALQGSVDAKLRLALGL